LVFNDTRAVSSYKLFNLGTSQRAKTDIQLISLMQHVTTAKILTILAQNREAYHKDIASCLGVTSQALSWQMNQLKSTGFIHIEKEGINVKYSLTDTNTAKLILRLTNI
jgi:predicted transcriptional regulator